MDSNTKEVIQKEGIVIEALPSTTFKVELKSGEEVLAHLSGKMRKNRIRVLTGDEVVMEFSPYDETRGRIIFRN